MARIALALATSHGPMLSTPPEQWGQRAQADRVSRAHHFRGGVLTYEELVQLRAEEGLGGQATVERWRERHAASQRALTTLADVFRRVAPTVAIIVGNDQNELFGDDNLPALAVFWGETIENIPHPPEQLAKLPPGLAIAEAGHCPPEGAVYPGARELGRHLIGHLVEHGFDVAQSSALPERGGSRHGIPHAFGFVYRRIMNDRAVPSIPIFINAMYPPNQPTVTRCCALGRALGHAITAWPEDATVAVIASGGLSHFVIDEDFDGRFLDAMKRRDDAALIKLPDDRFRAGTAEIKNWIPVATLAMGAGLQIEIVDYVPCYRTEAGTGNAMGFVYWH